MSGGQRQDGPAPSHATRIEDRTETSGVCGECGKAGNVHWSAMHVGWRCRACHPGRSWQRPVKAAGPDPFDSSRPIMSPSRGKRPPAGKDDYDLTKYEESEEESDE